MKEEIYLIDGSAYIYRAYHAIVPLTNSEGLPTHAVLGFINIIRRLIREKKAKHIVVAFDSRGEVFRHKLYPEYKANRPPMPEDLAVQIPYILKFVEAYGIPLIKEIGVEADDLIASATVHLQRLGHKVVIVSGDKDLLQLVGNGVVMWDPMKGKIMDPSTVKEKYNVTTAQLLDTFSLIGDSSDNVPGVPGVGPKTAEKLINTYGSLDGIYENIDAVKKSKMKEKIIANRDMAYLSRDLIRLKTDVLIPLELTDYLLRAADEEQLVAIYKELEFSSLLKEVNSATKIDPKGFRIVRTAEQLIDLVAELSLSEVLVIDTETSSINARGAQLVGLSLCVDLQKAWYIPLGHLDEQGILSDGQLTVTDVITALKPLLLSGEIKKIGHNLKYDITVLRQQCGLDFGGNIFDTLIAAYLTESGGRSFKLDDLCQERGVQLTPFEEVVAGDKRENCFAYVDIEKAAMYSCEDVYGAFLLWQEFDPLLAEKELKELFYKVEMPIVSILAEMEVAGICINDTVLENLSVEFKAKLQLLEKEIFSIAGHEFNISSPKQLAQVLFVELELPHGRKTKTGYSTDVKVLEKLAPKHPLPSKVLEFRTLAKLLSTYVEKLSLLKDSTTGRIHTSFNQAVTATGRLSSSDPNLQNIPIRTADGNRIREAFVPGEGMIFLAADYSQIDLRVLAHYSKDEALTDAFMRGVDIHAKTAAEIFGVSQLLVTSDMRRVAKSINFGIVYGMSSYGLAGQLGIGRKEAQKFIDRYFRLYSGVKKFMEEIVEQARFQGYVTTLLNRRRIVPEINVKNQVRRNFAERTAINTPIQGTAADIIKLAMIGCQQAITRSGVSARMLLQIHDELVFELPAKELEESRKVIKEAMEGALKLSVPLVVNFVEGTDLGKK